MVSSDTRVQSQRRPQLYLYLLTLATHLSLLLSTNRILQTVACWERGA
jgi:hypothetical protein